jgi:hypothetical protein
VAVNIARTQLLDLLLSLQLRAKTHFCHRMLKVLSNSIDELQRSRRSESDVPRAVNERIVHDGDWHDRLEMRRGELVADELLLREEDRLNAANRPTLSSSPAAAAAAAATASASALALPSPQNEEGRRKGDKKAKKKKKRLLTDSSMDAAPAPGAAIEDAPPALKALRDKQDGPKSRSPASSSSSTAITLAGSGGGAGAGAGGRGSSNNNHDDDGGGDRSDDGHDDNDDTNSEWWVPRPRPGKSARVRRAEEVSLAIAKADALAQQAEQRKQQQQALSSGGDAQTEDMVREAGISTGKVRRAGDKYAWYARLSLPARKRECAW